MILQDLVVLVLHSLQNIVDVLGEQISRVLGRFQSHIFDATLYFILPVLLLFVDVGACGPLLHLSVFLDFRIAVFVHFWEQEIQDETASLLSRETLLRVRDQDLEQLIVRTFHEGWCCTVILDHVSALADIRWLVFRPSWFVLDAGSGSLLALSHTLLSHNLI